MCESLNKSTNIVPNMVRLPASLKQHSNLAEYWRARAFCSDAQGSQPLVGREISEKFACLIQDLPERNLPMFEKKSWPRP